MNREEAEEYAKNMTYRDAIYNALQGKCIPYRKATLIKLYELLDAIEPKARGYETSNLIIDEFCGDCKYCGGLLKNNLHSCNNDKSLFKACLEDSIGCQEFEPQAEGGR